MLGRVMERVCIGGCGITGAVTASLLRYEGLPTSHSHITVWDKARGAGMIGVQPIIIDLLN